MRVPTVLFALLAFVAQPAAAASSPSLASLEQQLSYLVAGNSADVGIAALDLTTWRDRSASRVTRPSRWRAPVKVAGSPRFIFRRSTTGAARFDDTISGQPARSLMARMLHPQ
jgi:hypothetical protein